jgi:glycosyltransferase involved in cell wall biosynthesis
MNKINLLFDCRCLFPFLNKSEARATGISFVAWNVLQIMHKNKNLQISLAYTSDIRPKDLRKLKMHPFFSQFNLVSTGLGFMESLYWHIEHKNYAKIFYWHLRLTMLRIMEKFYYKGRIFSNIQIYLSAYHAISEKILEQKHIKKIYILHDTTPILFEDYFDTSAHRLYNKLIETLDKDTYAFCVSQSCKDDFLKYCGDKLDANKMFVTYNATNQNYMPNYDKQELVRVLKKYNVEHNSSDNYLLSLCSLEPRKNLHFTIACFLKFIKKHSIQNFYFYLGGSAWIHSKYTAIAKTLEEAEEYRHKIKLLGYIDNCDLNILYSNSLFFTYLSQYEGFGMPPLEAMQAGTPVITSNNSSLPEVVGDAAISVTYNDESAVIKAFEDFYFNQELRKEYIAKGLERAKMFSWEKTVSQMVSIIKEIAK